jgi:hypothetical protein
MSEGKEIIVAEHPKAWVVRMVEGRGLKVAEKTLYWWRVHLERFLKFCRCAGAESSEISVVVERGRVGKWEGLEFSPFWRVAFEVGVDGFAEF